MASDEMELSRLSSTFFLAANCKCGRLSVLFTSRVSTRMVERSLLTVSKVYWLG